MQNKKILIYSFLCSVGLTLYVTGVAWFLSQGSYFFKQVSDIIVGTIMLLLFVFSALISGLLILGGPIYLYLEKNKKKSFIMLGLNIFWILIIFFLILIINFSAATCPPGVELTEYE